MVGNVCSHRRPNEARKRQDNSHKVFTRIEAINYFRVEITRVQTQARKSKEEEVKKTKRWKMSMKSNACEHTFNFSNC